MGTWMQNVTVPYVVFLITQRATLVGVAAAVQMLPGVIMGPVGGWLADRFDRRLLLISGQIAQGVLAAFLWVAWISGMRSPALLIFLLCLNGIAFGLTIPAWQAFLSDLVPRSDLLNAITLNSAQFNAARALGPALGGFVLARFGPSWAFLINALSFLAVIGALLITHPPKPDWERTAPSRGPVGQFLDALAYCRSRPELGVAMTLIASVFFLGNPVFQLAPVFARRIYGVGAGLYGLLAAAYGCGAVFGSLMLGMFGSHRTRSRIIVFSFGLYSAGLAGFSLAPVYAVGFAFLFITGAAFLMAVATLNTSVQLLVPEQMRGRVLSIYIMALTGSYPLGALAQGWLADRIGAPRTVLIAAVCLFGVWLLLIGSPRLPEMLDGPDEVENGEVGLVAEPAARPPGPA